jgi:Integrase core domain
MKLTGTNQLWVADITFVRLKREFVYLAVVLDRFSRKVVGWNLDRTLTARLPLMALENALKERKPAPGLVHHSDRGAPYSHTEYLRTLSMHGIVSSISRPEGLATMPTAKVSSELSSGKRLTRKITRIWKIFDSIFQHSSNVTTTERDCIQRLGIGRLRNSRRQPTLPMQQASRLSRNSNSYIKETFTLATRAVINS